MPNLATDLARGMELRVARNRCDCHPETCGHWAYNLMLGELRIANGERHDLEQIASALNAWKAGGTPRKETPNG